MNVGTELRHAREARGLSLDTLAARTRIQARLLDSIEREDLATVPPRPYGRGFVAAYAREVGLEPTETVRNYFAQFGTAPAHPHPPPASSFDRSAVDDDRSRQWIAAAAILSLLIVAGAVRLWTTSPPDVAEAGAIGTTGAEPAAPVPAAAVTTAAPAPVSPAAAGSTPEPFPLVVVLEADRNSWITASTDGSRRLFRIVRAGERETLRASRDIVIRVGDAGAMRWSVNGADPKVMGRPGEVRTERLAVEP